MVFVSQVNKIDNVAHDNQISHDDDTDHDNHDHHIH